MCKRRCVSAIGVSLIGLGLLLATPDVGTSQETVRSGISADRPVSYHLSALHSNSWLTRGGIWVRHNGMWAFRPTFNYDPQAYFRCRMGFGCRGFGWGSYSSLMYGSWLPFGYASWDLVPGGWMWFPGHRLSSSRAWDLYWDLWFVGSRYRSAPYGYGRPFSLHGGLTWLDRRSIQPHRWDLRQDAARFPIYGDRGTFTPPRPDGGDVRSPARTAPTTPSIDPVRLGPRVDSRASGASQRRVQPKPTARPVEPRDRASRQFPAPSTTKKVKSPRAPASRTPASGQTKSNRPKSPRTPASGTPSTGKVKPKGKTTPEQ